MKRILLKSVGRAVLYMVLLLLVILFMWMLRTCSSSTPFDIREKSPSQGDTLDVAIEYSPMSLYMYDDTLGGYDYDMLRALARINRIPLKFHPIVTVEEALGGLDAGLYDIVAADIPMTTEYQDSYLFTDPVYLDRQVLVQLRDSSGDLSVKSQLDLARKSVHVPAGSPIISRIRNLSSEIGDTIYVVPDSTYGSEQLFLLTVTGEIPYAVINQGIAKKLAQSYPDADISTDISFTQFQSWIVSKDKQALVDSLNSMLLRFSATDEYRRLSERYLY